MFIRVLNKRLDDTSKLDWSNECVLLWKPSVFIVLPIILNQSKSKTILHTVFETFINNSSRNKTQKVSWWVLWVRDSRNIHNSFFLIKIVIGKLEVVYSGSLKCYKVFFLKFKKRSPKRWKSPKKEWKLFTRQEIQKRHWKVGKWKTESIRNVY